FPVGAVGDVFGVFLVEEVVVQPHLGVDRVGGGDPVDGALDLAAVGAVAASGGGVVGAGDFGHLAGVVLHHAGALDAVRVAEGGPLPGEQPKILGPRDFAKIVLLDVQHPPERQLARAGGGVFGVVDGVEFLGLAFGVVGDDDLQRMQDGQAALGTFVQV